MYHNQFAIHVCVCVGQCENGHICMYGYAHVCEMHDLSQKNFAKMKLNKCENEDEVETFEINST